MERQLAIAAVALTALACGYGGGGGDGGTGPVVDGIDTSVGGLTAFVKAGTYKTTWTAEAAVHTSAGPHGSVRAYFSDKLVTSLRAANAVHPAGSAAVKELYTGTNVVGHAMSIKVAEGPQRDNWTWFEGNAPDYTNPIYGRASPSCANCHVGGRDFVMSATP